MLLTPHFIVGGVVGQYVGNPAGAFFAGVATHIVLDAIPHFDSIDKKNWSWRQYSLLFFDFLLLVVLIFGVMRPEISLKSSFFWGALGGIVIDLFDVVPFWKKRFRRTKIGKAVHQFHEKLHIIKKPAIFIGVMSQIIVIAIFVYLYLFVR